MKADGRYVSVSWPYSIQIAFFIVTMEGALAVACSSGISVLLHREQTSLLCDDTVANAPKADQACASVEGHTHVHVHACSDVVICAEAC